MDMTNSLSTVVPINFMNGSYVTLRVAQLLDICQLSFPLSSSIAWFNGVKMKSSFHQLYVLGHASPAVFSSTSKSIKMLTICLAEKIGQQNFPKSGQGLDEVELRQDNCM